MCQARQLNAGYRLQPPELVGDVATLFERLSEAQLIGFDFPIGVPAKYAEMSGIEDFLAALLNFRTSSTDPQPRRRRYPSRVHSIRSGRAARARNTW